MLGRFLPRRSGALLTRLVRLCQCSEGASRGPRTDRGRICRVRRTPRLRSLRARTRTAPHAECRFTKRRLPVRAKGQPTVRCCVEEPPGLAEHGFHGVLSCAFLRPEGSSSAHGQNFPMSTPREGGIWVSENWCRFRTRFTHCVVCKIRCNCRTCRSPIATRAIYIYIYNP